MVWAEPVGVIYGPSQPNDCRYQYGASGRLKRCRLTWPGGIWNPQQTIVIAVIDTGIEDTHEDLTNKMYRDGSGNVIGYNEFTGVEGATGDDNGHGTHCAGIAAAQINNADGIAGISGWNGVAGYSDTTYTKLMPVKVDNADDTGSPADLEYGIVWAAQHGANVLSISQAEGGYTDASGVREAIAYAYGQGCFIAAAAGNDGGSTPNYPADDPGALSVAASDCTDTLASFSSWGTWVATAAPGVEIESTWNYDGYHNDSGTSMAAPLIAGEAALMWAQNPGFSNQQIYDSIISAVDSVAPYQSGETIGPGGTGGRANVYRALQGCVPGKIVACADFRGDGLPDFAFQNSSSGQAAIWAMDGSTLLWGAGVAGTVSSGYNALFAGCGYRRLQPGRPQRPRIPEQQHWADCILVHQRANAGWRRRFLPNPLAKPRTRAACGRPSWGRP